MNQYKVKKETAKNGEQTFYVQKRCLFIWYKITKMIGYDT